MAAFPSIELSSAQKTKDPGNKRFQFNEGYAAGGLKGKNARREVWTWTWSNITVAQAETLDAFFSGLEGDYVTWTPYGQSSPKKFLPLGTFGVDYPENQFDTANFQITVGQTFTNA